jgi:hypothetical protein
VVQYDHDLGAILAPRTDTARCGSGRDGKYLDVSPVQGSLGDM